MVDAVGAAIGPVPVGRVVAHYLAFPLHPSDHVLDRLGILLPLLTLGPRPHWDVRWGRTAGTAASYGDCSSGALGKSV